MESPLSPVGPWALFTGYFILLYSLIRDGVLALIPTRRGRPGSRDLHVPS